MDPRSDNQFQNTFNGYFNDEYSDGENVDTREIDEWYDRMEKEEEEHFKAQDEEEKKVSFIHSNGITIRVENNPIEDEEEFKDGDFKSKELIIKSNNITIKIIKSHQYPHAIFDVKNLLQLVQDYLQYEDELEVFIWFRLSKPVRPLSQDIFNPNHNPDLINVWYYKYPIDIKFLTDFYKKNMDTDKEVYFKCFRCNQYNKTKPNIEGKPELYYSERGNYNKLSTSPYKFPAYTYSDPDYDSDEIENLTLSLCPCTYENKYKQVYIKTSMMMSLLCDYNNDFLHNELEILNK